MMMSNLIVLFFILSSGRCDYDYDSLESVTLPPKRAQYDYYDYDYELVTVTLPPKTAYDSSKKVTPKIEYDDYDFVTLPPKPTYDQESDEKVIYQVECNLLNNIMFSA